MIAVIVPAHNEADHIGACLQSLHRAAKCPALRAEPVAVVVALDHCTDATETIAKHYGVQLVRCRARNVGVARARGAQRALAMGARWLAFTDADSEVAPDWISEQLRLNTDVVCGTVHVRDWGAHNDTVRKTFHQQYRDCDGHRHIHGANLGLTAQAYQSAGGFQPLVTGEDVALVQALQAQGHSIAWSAAPRVNTSARLHTRAPHGFGAALVRMGGERLAPCNDEVPHDRLA